MQNANGLRAVALFIAVIGFLAATAMQAVAETKGNAKVLSGDTLRIKGKELRLNGVDAPERDQYCEDQYLKIYQCGTYAYDALREMIGRVTVTCVDEVEGEDGEVRATCFAGDLNLNSRMVRDGWGVARGDENPNYPGLEKLAKNQKKGIWKYIFQDPKKWREENQ